MKLPAWVRGWPCQKAGSHHADDAGGRHVLVVVGGAREHVDVRVEKAHQL
jgi:hypothetical protein